MVFLNEPYCWNKDEVKLIYVGRNHYRVPFAACRVNNFIQNVCFVKGRFAIDERDCAKEGAKLTAHSALVLHFSLEIMIHLSSSYACTPDVPSISVYELSCKWMGF